MPHRIFAVLCLLLAAASLASQVPTKSTTLTAIVTDPTGARVPAAALHIAATDGSLTRDLTTDPTGHIELNLPPGAYTLTVTSPGFDPFFKELKLTTKPLTLDVKLLIATAQTVVQVNSNPHRLGASPDNNKDAIDLTSRQLQTLSSNDSTFQQQILSLAGGDDSQSPQVFVDGFSGGKFPPKGAIREIKINRNPYSAEYDTLGMGRVEIFTKPGTGRFHGELETTGNTSAFNSQNPFVHTPEPSYFQFHTGGYLSGPINGKTSFFLNADTYYEQNNAVINAQTVAPNSNAIQSISLAQPDPDSNYTVSGRLDRQWSTNNTVVLRYEYDGAAQTNAGLGAVPYTLPTEAFNSSSSSGTFQISNSAILGKNAVLDAHFQWERSRSAQDPVSDAPNITVSGTVNDGGSAAQVDHDSSNQFEFQANGTYAHGKHLFRFGARYRINRDANLSTEGFNGAFTFNTLAAYQASVTPAGPNGGTPSATPSASQFTITRGQDSFKAITTDLGAWVEDEVKFSPSLTGQFGVRLETQSAIPDHFDPSPHFTLAWAPRPGGRKSAPVVYRIGSAIFYTRYPLTDLMTTVRQSNPAIQTTYTLTNPHFFARTSAQLQQNIDLSSASSAQTTTYTLDPNYRSPYQIASGASVEFSLGDLGNITVNYMNTRGVHQLASRNANAPLPDGTRPFGAAAGDMDEFFTGGESLGNSLNIRPDIQITKGLEFWGSVSFRELNKDAFGGFTSNSYNIHQDYGPADRRRAVFAGIDGEWKYGLSGSMFLAAHGGSRYNITTGADNNGDSIFNDRPSFATATDIATNPASVIRTSLGTFNLAPSANERPIPYNYGHAPVFVSLQAELAETVKFGPPASHADDDDDDDDDASPTSALTGDTPKPEPRFALTFSIEAQNLTNTISAGTPIGVLTSPYFGQSLSSANNFLDTTAANRTLTLQTTFRF